MKEISEKIAIIGVGLIGGSIALGLKQHYKSKITIYGACRDPKRAENAIKQGIIDRAIYDVKKIPTDMDLIILAVPVKTEVEILKALAKISFKNCLILDVGSTKKFILQQVQRILPGEISFIGTHPMAGKELSGFENSSPSLFVKKPWIVCPSLSVKTEDINIIKKLITALGAKIFMMDAETHDELTSWISHLQLSLSSILVNTIAREKKWEIMGKIASGGFRDSTRSASNNSEMKTDIILTNKANIITSLNKVNREINKFSKMIERSNDKEILKYFSTAKEIRNHWLSQT